MTIDVSIIQCHACAGPPGNGTPSESQLLDAYYAEARRLIDAPDEVRDSKPAFMYPGVFQNFICAMSRVYPPMTEPKS